MFEINIINTGYIFADGGAMFGAIPKRAWQRKYACNDENLCRLAMRCVLATSADRKILIDTGIGEQVDKRHSYYQPHNLLSVAKAIAQYGLTPSDITDVVLTHLHFDHCGYATYLSSTGERISTFPNATYWLSQKQWTHTANPNRLESDSIYLEYVRPIYEAGLLHLVDGDTLLCDGFDLQLFDGHSEGQLVPIISTKKGISTFPGDLIPTSAHVPIEWISAYDICALTSALEKERFLEDAIEKDYTLIYCHDTAISHSKVKRLNNNFKATDAHREK